MKYDVYSSVPHVALADRMAGRNHFLRRRARTDCVLSFAYSSSGRKRREPVVAYFALDGDYFRPGLSGKFHDL